MPKYQSKHTEQNFKRGLIVCRKVARSPDRRRIPIPVPQNEHGFYETKTADGISRTCSLCGSYTTALIGLDYDVGLHHRYLTRSIAVNASKKQRSEQHVGRSTVISPA